MKDFRITTPKDKEAVKAYLDRLPDGKRYDVGRETPSGETDAEPKQPFSLVVFLHSRRNGRR